jgi:hypothetical protein
MINSRRNDDGSITITINNGEVEALSNIESSWGIRDDASVLKFAIGAMLNAKNRKLYVDVDDKGTKGYLVIPDELKTESGSQNEPEVQQSSN